MGGALAGKNNILHFLDPNPTTGKNINTSVLGHFWNFPKL
jgi:hypothetical protein